MICWCLPISEPVRRENRRETLFPSRAWAYTRTAGNNVLGFTERALVEHFEARGFPSLAPTDTPENTAEPRPGVGLSSRWSLRHVAFVAGLGTFGLSGGLIHPSRHRPSPGGRDHRGGHRAHSAGVRG